MRRSNTRLFGRIALLLAASTAVVGAFAASFPIADTGVFPVPYEKFGRFSGVGTNSYSYKIADRAGLARAVGEGVWPNATYTTDPAYLAWRKKNPGPQKTWSHVDSGDPQADFYVWSAAKDVSPGVRQLFIARALADGGHIKQALKAYHAVLLHYPRDIGWSSDQSFVWYVSNEAINQIENLTNRHPDVGYRLEGARFRVENGEDTTTANDQFEIDPGRWVKAASPAAVPLSSLKVKQQRGYGKVQLVQFENGHWQMRVDGKPYFVRGLTYTPTPIGQHLSGAANRWMTLDSDENGKPDAPYDTWVDANRNDRQDAGETAVGDFELMRRMGANTIRIYRGGNGLEYDPAEINKATLRDLCQTYGIRVIMGDFLGAYTVGSGATWEDGTDYTDPVQLENMRRLVREYVMDHRAEPYVLFWVLGNENLMPADYSGVNATRTKASLQIEAYLSFVNEIADMIHRLDPDHPVAVGNLDVLNAADHGKYAPNVDIFGANFYRGANGAGNAWKVVRAAVDRPVCVMEYGCDAWDSRTGKPNEAAQANYHQGNWTDIQFHAAGGGGQGNSIGGVAFEFVDEWWKSSQGPWDVHNTENDASMAFPDGFSSEEWLGLVSLGEGLEDPFLRQLRKAYLLYRDELWKVK